jgi:hypothetical protein
LCIYCETGNKLKTDVMDYTLNNTTLKKEFSIDSYLEYFTENKNEEIIEKLEHLKEIEFHKQVAERQRKVYNRYRTDPKFLGNDSIFIDVDWKEKICYGKNGPRQVNGDWYNSKLCSLLSFGIYYVDKKHDPGTKEFVPFVNCLTIDILSDDLSQTATDFINRFRFIRNLDIFRQIEKSNYIIYSDTAKQFRCEEICHFYMVELAQKGIRVSFNYFCEYHGKVKNLILNVIYLKKKFCLHKLNYINLRVLEISTLV